MEIVIITHHSEAQEVDEDSFFRIDESGGTKVSSAYQLRHDIIYERYDPVQWNIYPFHFSDGDNWSDNDNKVCVELVNKLWAVSNLLGYGEIRDGGYTSSLVSAFTAIKDPRFVIVTITEKRDVSRRCRSGSAVVVWRWGEGEILTLKGRTGAAIAALLR